MGRSEPSMIEASHSSLFVIALHHRPRSRIESRPLQCEERGEGGGAGLPGDDPIGDGGAGAFAGQCTVFERTLPLMSVSTASYHTPGGGVSASKSGPDVTPLTELNSPSVAAQRAPSGVPVLVLARIFVSFQRSEHAPAVPGGATTPERRIPKPCAHVPHDLAHALR